VYCWKQKQTIAEKSCHAYQGKCNQHTYSLSNKKANSLRIINDSR